MHKAYLVAKLFKDGRRQFGLYSEDHMHLTQVGDGGLYATMYFATGKSYGEARDELASAVRLYMPWVAREMGLDKENPND